MGFMFEIGRQEFANGGIDWDTDTIKSILLDLNTADVGIKAITGATNPGNPIQITATSHGFANGDLVFIDGILGNLAANGYWKVANQAANTFDITRLDGTNTTGSGAYTSGGYAVCLGPSAAGDFLDDFSAARISTDQTLGSKTLASGVLDAADVSHPGWATTTVEAVAIYRDSGAEAGSHMIVVLPGKHIVFVAADAAGSATTVWCEPLDAGIPNGSAIVFSNGVTATLTSLAAEGARSLAVSALASPITAGNQGLAPATNSGLPVTGNGNALNVAWSNGANRILKL